MDVDAESCESCIEPDAKPRGDEQPEKKKKASCYFFWFRRDVKVTGSGMVYLLVIQSVRESVSEQAGDELVR